MHNHHSALGLASLPSETASGLKVAMQRPVQPVTLIRPHAARRAARFFVEKFPGRSLYAVKANPSPDLLQILWESGVSHYDVASIAEVKLVAETLPGATICFMHPVKAVEAIEDAYFNYEAHLMRTAGAHVGGCLHVARSRNDILSTMDRMRARLLVLDLLDAGREACAAALANAERYADVVMPGYTHLQPAQPITYGYWLLGVAESLARDLERLQSALPKLQRCPLGAGALAGKRG